MTKHIDVPVVVQRPVPAIQKVQKTVEVPQVQHIDKIMDLPAVKRHQEPTIQTEQKIAEVSDAQNLDQVIDVHVETQQQLSTLLIDTVVDVPVMAQRQVYSIQRVQKTVEVPQIQFIDKFTDAPVSVQAEGKKRKLPLPAEGKTASGDEEEDEGETHAPVHFSLCDSDQLETRSKGEHEGATIRQVDDILLEMKDVKSELLHVRELIGVLVRKERCSETKAEIAARELDRLEREQDEQDYKESETNLQEALSDKTKAVKLVIDKWVVDKGFGFGKVPTGETVFIHASVVHGGEVLMVGTDAWVQVVNDEARAEGGYRARNAWGRNGWKGGEGQGKGE